MLLNQAKNISAAIFAVLLIHSLDGKSALDCNSLNAKLQNSLPALLLPFLIKYRTKPPACVLLSLSPSL